MKKSLSLLYTILLICSFFNILNAQSLQTMGKEKLTLNSLAHSKNSSDGGTFKFITMLSPINPIVEVENSKVYFGLTKEVVLGVVGLGHLGVEYSHLFRTDNSNQLRFSYNYDFFTKPSDFAAFLISVGGGYFTDFNKKGYFPQVSLGMLLAIFDYAGVVPYIKLRNTFITDKTQSNIFDFSLGLKTAFYF